MGNEPSKRHSKSESDNINATRTSTTSTSSQRHHSVFDRLTRSRERLNSNILKGSELKDLSNLTGMSEDVIKDLFKKFTDQSNGGTLNKNEFIKLYCSLREEPYDKIAVVAEHAFNAFDRDKNGSIDYKEFIIAFALTSRGNIRDKLEFTFKMYDFDENGYLDKNELKHLIEVMLSMLNTENRELVIESVLKECFKLLDTSKDGKISKNEFIEGLINNYSLRSLLCPFN